MLAYFLKTLPFRAVLGSQQNGGAGTASAHGPPAPRAGSPLSSSHQTVRLVQSVNGHWRAIVTQVPGQVRLTLGAAPAERGRTPKDAYPSVSPLSSLSLFFLKFYLPASNSSQAPSSCQENPQALQDHARDCTSPVSPLALKS